MYNIHNFFLFCSVLLCAMVSIKIKPNRKAYKLSFISFCVCNPLQSTLKNSRSSIFNVYNSAIYIPNYLILWSYKVKEFSFEKKRKKSMEKKCEPIPISLLYGSHLYTIFSYHWDDWAIILFPPKICVFYIKSCI